MSVESQSICIPGCKPEPLASYLKAVGILRIVSEQLDPDALGSWSGDVFTLHTKFGREKLRDFFISAYQPSPMVAPWNGGSGFYPKDNQNAITALSEGTAAR